MSYMERTVASARGPPSSCGHCARHLRAHELLAGRGPRRTRGACGSDDGYVARYALAATITRSCAERCNAWPTRSRSASEGSAIASSSTVRPCRVRRSRATRAGLDRQGTRICSTGDGSWFLLGELYTDLPLPPETPVAEHCGSCRACLDVSPRKRFVAPYESMPALAFLYLPSSCAARSGVATRRDRQPDLRLRRLPALLSVEKFAGRRPSATSRSSWPRQHGLVSLFRMVGAGMDARTAGSALRRPGYEGWLRNVAVALGNAPADERVVAALTARADIRRRSSVSTSAGPRTATRVRLARLGLPTASRFDGTATLTIAPNGQRTYA